MKRKDLIQPEGNYYDKYNTQNPIAKKLMENFFKSLERMIDDLEKPVNVLEAGCGEGAVANFIYQKLNGKCNIDAFDISKRLMEEAILKYENINFTVGNVYEMGGGYDLVVCSEVLEHLEYPEKALSQLYSATEKYIIVSVPREPVWRVLNLMRGKYIKDLGNTPGHIQHWSKRSFIKFLKKAPLKILKIESPLPWTMVLLEKM